MVSPNCFGEMLLKPIDPSEMDFSMITCTLYSVGITVYDFPFNMSSMTV